MAIAPTASSPTKKRKMSGSDLSATRPACGVNEPDPATAVAVGVATNRGGKTNQEDAYFIGGKMPARLTLNGYSSGMSGCFGVFDGHGGDRASRYCAEHLFPKIQEEIEANTESKIEAAITTAVHAIDEEFCTMARRCSRPDLSRTPVTEVPLPNAAIYRSYGMEDGSTCLVAIVRDGKLYVGNVGDSRAVLATFKGKPISLSDDQKPSRKDERARLEAKGAVVTGSPGFMYHLWPINRLIDVPRVNGALAMSRSMGDLSLKPWITCEPEIKTHTITSDDKFLIMASDGLWDVVSNKAAAKVAASYDDPQKAADALVALALAKKTYDNITVLVVAISCFGI